MRSLYLGEPIKEDLLPLVDKNGNFLFFAVKKEDGTFRTRGMLYVKPSDGTVVFRQVKEHVE